MKLDFSALMQPTAKARGQVGTTGTPAFTRVSASPLALPCGGATGDPAVLLVADPVVAILAACPPVSPACPQVADAEKRNAGAVSPVSPLAPIAAAQVAPAAPFERDDVVGKPTGTSVNTCGNCLHLLRRGTCGEPAAAGLLTAEEGFGIVWPPDGHCATCDSYSSKTTVPGQNRPYKLTLTKADSCHAGGWDGIAIARFQVRAAALRRRGVGDDDADDLAEQLHLRDVQADRRIYCLECRHLAGSLSTGWRCGNHRAAAVGRDLQLALVTMAQVCGGFGLAGGVV